MLPRPLQGSGGTGEGFEVVKYGDGRVALIGAAGFWAAGSFGSQIPSVLGRWILRATDTQVSEPLDPSGHKYLGFRALGLFRPHIPRVWGLCQCHRDIGGLASL